MASKPLALDHSRLTWTQLHYKATKLFIKSEATVELQTIPASEVVSSLVAPGQGVGVEPTNSTGIYLKLNAKFLNRDILTRGWIEPDNANALQRLIIETGAKRGYKFYRFTNKGTFSLRKKPKGNEKDLSSDQWTDVSENLYHYAESGEGNFNATLPVGIFYILATAELNTRGDKIETLVFSKKHLNLVTISVRETIKLNTNYTLVSKSGQRIEVKGRAVALRVSLRPRPLANGEVDFDFLGFKGDVDIILDKKYRVPLRLLGKAKYIGKLEINLDQLTLK